MTRGRLLSRVRRLPVKNELVGEGGVIMPRFSCRQRASVSLLTLSVAGALACSSPTGGVCIVQYLDPIITIAQVVDARTTARVPDIAIKDVRFSGMPTDVRTLVAVSAPTFGVTVQGNELQCQVACGFGV